MWGLALFECGSPRKSGPSSRSEVVADTPPTQVRGNLTTDALDAPGVRDGLGGRFWLFKFTITEPTSKRFGTESAGIVKQPEKPVLNPRNAYGLPGTIGRNDRAASLFTLTVYLSSGSKSEPKGTMVSITG